MQIACGTDIIEIDRVKMSIENIGEKFKETIFTKDEIKYCESKKAQKYQHYAARFAAKEAIFKALSKYLDQNICKWQNFEILNDNTGKPIVNLKSKVDAIDSIDISISHCKDYAVAMVVATLN